MTQMHAEVGEGLGAVDPDLPGKLDVVIGDKRAVDDVRRYFTDLDGDWFNGFTGAWFERLASAGQVEAPNLVVADDIVALSLLSIRVRGAVALKLLVDRRDEISKLLREIPSDVPLWEADREMLAGPASELWTLFRHIDEHDDDGNRWVTAGKLLARKRPALIPIFDSHVKEVAHLSKGTGWWASLRAALQDGDRRSRIEQMGRDAGVPSHVTLLRTLDVALWMHARRSHDIGEIEE